MTTTKTARGDGTDTCRACGAESLYGTEGTEERPGQWVLVCTDCGHDQDRRPRRTRKA